MALTPGLLLSDRYRLTHRIAVGGMGEVWAADDTRLARQVAVKILKSELTSDPEFVDRFRAEARITASLNHPGIAAVYDYGEVASIAGGPRDTAYLVMELVTGEPLSAVLARTPRLSLPRTLDVLEQSGRALQVAHARALVHRDIKPGNILITPAGQVKITDFGIAKVAYQVPVTRGGMVMGTAQYLSPEQAAGNEALPASDIYALGVVAYECLAGVRPFNGDNPVMVAMAQVSSPPPPLPPDVPPPVAGLVLRMLAKDPARRFPDGATLARAVAQVRAGGVVSATGAFPVVPVAPISARQPLPPRPVGAASRAATRPPHRHRAADRTAGDRHRRRCRDLPDHPRGREHRPAVGRADLAAQRRAHDHRAWPRLRPWHRHRHGARRHPEPAGTDVAADRPELHRTRRRRPVEHRPGIRQRRRLRRDAGRCRCGRVAGT